MVALIKSRRGPAEPEPTYGRTGWRSFDPQATPNVQIGAYGDRWLNAYPGMSPEIQRESLRGGLNQNLLVASTSDLPIWQQSQYPANAAQTQRHGSSITGTLGPISALSLQDRVAQGQVRQSGIQAVNWAQALAGQ